MEWAESAKCCIINSVPLHTDLFISSVLMRFYRQCDKIYNLFLNVPPAQTIKAVLYSLRQMIPCLRDVIWHDINCIPPFSFWIVHADRNPPDPTENSLLHHDSCLHCTYIFIAGAVLRLKPPLDIPDSHRRLAVKRLTYGIFKRLRQTSKKKKSRTHCRSVTSLFKVY